MSASWVAIDFETATQSRASACAIGMVTVEDGAVVAEREILIQPPWNEYDEFNIAIHGITPEDTADAPTFAEVWPEIENTIDGRLVLAHNAGFDFSVLRHAFEEFAVAECTINYGCTLVLGRRHWKGLPSYSLPLLCDAVGVDLVDHHEALSDARACSGLASRLLKELGVASIEEAAAELRVSLGQVGAKDIRCLAADVRALMPQPNADADPDHPFFGRHVSFTGALLQWTRAEAASLVATRGGIPSDGVTKKTNYLVTGDQDPVKLRGKPMSGKAAKAALYASRGQEIEVLTELDFTRLLLG